MGIHGMIFHVLAEFQLSISVVVRIGLAESGVEATSRLAEPIFPFGTSVPQVGNVPTYLSIIILY